MRSTLLCSFLCAFLAISAFAQQPTQPISERLAELNPYWTVHPDALPTQPLAEEPATHDALIQLHLTLVGKHLKQQPTNHLSAGQLANRMAALENLNEYMQNGRFPRNTRHEQTTSCFIDDYGTACAVGHLMIESGNEAFARYIQKTNN